jgi:hypothetical protein
MKLGQGLVTGGTDGMPARHMAGPGKVSQREFWKGHNSHEKTVSPELI